MRAKWNPVFRMLGWAGLLWSSGLWFGASQPGWSQDTESSALTLVVMDPLSAPLACDCVQGYAQRKYEKLALHLAKQLQREVKIVWAESIPAASKETHGRVDIVVAKHSVALANAADLKLELQPVASLTDKEGETAQWGLIVVRKDDAAAGVADLRGYRFLFGPKECEEKHAAPIALLRGAGVEVAEELETFAACSVAATKLLDLPQDENAAAMISSYAAPLLEGCGTIKKGDLRVVGKTEPVRFITAFVNKDLDDSLRHQITKSLIAAGEDADLLTALETDSGFVAFAEDALTEIKTSPASSEPPAASIEQKKN